MTLVPSRSLSGRWRAAYAWRAEWGGPGLTVRRFRRRFSLSEVPERVLCSSAPFLIDLSKGQRKELQYETVCEYVGVQRQKSKRGL